MRCRPPADGGRAELVRGWPGHALRAAGIRCIMKQALEGVVQLHVKAAGGQVQMCACGRDTAGDEGGRLAPSAVIGAMRGRMAGWHQDLGAGAKKTGGAEAGTSSKPPADLSGVRL
jgi:hypothetical protein